MRSIRKKVEPYNLEAAIEIHKNAVALFKCPGHPNTDEYKGSCRACLLNGYISVRSIKLGARPGDSPNLAIASWPRYYVQAKKKIPKNWIPCFFEYIFDHQSREEGGYSPIEQDIATYGVAFKD